MVGAERSMLMMGDNTLCKGVQSPESTAMAKARTKDNAKHITVRSNVQPTDAQKFALAKSLKNSTITLSGAGKTNGLSLTAATIHHIPITSNRDNSGYATFSMIFLVLSSSFVFI